MKRRPQHAQTERAGVLALARAINSLGMIWRDTLQEDVGVDGTVELVSGQCPTGKLVGIQVKSGASYIRSETPSHFRFYPDPDDLAYWLALTIPVFLIVYDPRDEALYWLDVQKHVHARHPFTESYLEFDKGQRVDQALLQYLQSKFDLSIHTDAEHAATTAFLDAIVYEDPSLAGTASIKATDLLVKGLWGMCTKLQFHTSLLTECLRSRLGQRNGLSQISYDLSRATLLPFFTAYFRVLIDRNLAILDVDDINHSIYSKLEWPTFVASLTTNGRAFVRYLRDRARRPDVHDNQFYSLRVVPHMQVEVYSSYASGAVQPFGPYTDVFQIGFNGYLDYYRVLRISRAHDSDPRIVLHRTFFYYELVDYLGRALEHINKDHIMCRSWDTPISPLACWLERFLEIPQGLPPAEFRQRTASEQIAMTEEMFSILSPAGALSINEGYSADMRFLQLVNGEVPFRSKASASK